ncbi:MAG: DUF2191 domain-containing protein [Acidobacteriota bacterium]|nr:MAG: DUF2191 domain-containing protein [Acidobacteriota bacterium]
MKITVNISDSLLEEARKVAAGDKTTVKDLIERGLRKILAECKSTRDFRLRDASFKGEGLQPGVVEGDWERIRDLIYERRGS